MGTVYSTRIREEKRLPRGAGGRNILPEYSGRQVEETRVEHQRKAGRKKPSPRGSRRGILFRRLGRVVALVKVIDRGLVADVPRAPDHATLSLFTRRPGMVRGGGVARGRKQAMARKQK
jgi:hypothetical protein